MQCHPHLKHILVKPNCKLQPAIHYFGLRTLDSIMCPASCSGVSSTIDDVCFNMFPVALIRQIRHLQALYRTYVENCEEWLNSVYDRTMFCDVLGFLLNGCHLTDCVTHIVLMPLRESIALVRGHELRTRNNSFVSF
jgi:hypothetical protein